MGRCRIDRIERDVKELGGGVNWTDLAMNRQLENWL